MKIIFILRKSLRIIFITSLSIFYFRVPWINGGISNETEEHETYLNKFKNSIFHKIKALVQKSLEEEPVLKSRKKIVEVKVCKITCEPS